MLTNQDIEKGYKQKPFEHLIKDNKNVRTFRANIIKQGNSHVMVIPAKIVKELELQFKGQIDVKIKSIYESWTEL